MLAVIATALAAPASAPEQAALAVQPQPAHPRSWWSAERPTHAGRPGRPAAHEAGVESTGEHAWCMEDQSNGWLKVPSFYLLGCQKCASTSLAAMMGNAGMEFPNGKEWHWLNDNLCAHSNCKDATVDDSVRTDFAVGALDLKGEHFSCEDTAMLGDASPENVMLIDLPTVFDHLYGNGARHLNFVILLREPFQRMQSQYYWNDENFHQTQNWWDSQSFSDYATSLYDHLPGNYTAVYDVMAADTYGTYGTTMTGEEYDPFVTGMYAVQLRQWLEHSTFSGSQFVVMPSGWAITNYADAMELISTTFTGLTLNTSAVEAPEDGASTTHPSVEADVPATVYSNMNTVYFDPMVSDLADVLADGMTTGVKIGGLDVFTATATQIEAHFRDNWEL